MPLDFQFRELGNSGFQTSNVARVVAAGATTIANAVAGTIYTVYQIDYDLSVTGQNLTIGDNNANPSGGDRIVLDQKGVSYGTRVYPQGLIMRAGQALTANVTSSAGVDCWFRVTYTTDNLKRS